VVERCWICGRTEAEVSHSMAGGTDRELELETKLASVKKAQDEYFAGYRDWLSPEKKDYDLGLAPLRALNRARAVMGGPSFQLGVADFSRMSGGKYLRPKMEEFEKKTGTRIYADQGPSVGMPFFGVHHWQLDGKSPDEILRMGNTAAEVYFGTQMEVLNDELAEERKKRPLWNLHQVKFSDSPTSVFVCEVCARLKGLAKEEDWDFDDDDGGSHGGGDEYADDYAEPDTRD
jgi:hypothetical protein